MPAYSDRAFSALAQFNGRLSAFTESVKATRPDKGRLSQKTLDELGKRSGTPAMVLTDTMAPGTQAHVYEAITPVVTPKH